MEPIISDFEMWIGAQSRKIQGHRGLQHPLFQDLTTRCQSDQFLRIAARQIYHVVLGFPFHIAGAIGSCRDERILRTLVHNLYAEVGGADGEAHISIYRKFLRALSCSVERPQMRELWPETVALESSCNSLYRSEDLGTKLGSLFAFELMSSPMVSKWDQALRTVGRMAPESFEFFTIHIDIETDHVNDIADCTRDHWRDESFQVSFQRAASAVMEALERFWDRMESIPFESAVYSVGNSLT